MTIPIRVLIVEDSDDDTALLVRELERGGYQTAFLRVETAEAMRTALKTQAWDVIISDYAIPHFGGLGALRIFKEEQLDIPFIIVSGTIGEDIAVAAMKAGAHDYVMKRNLPRLVPAIERELREAEERRARRRAEEALQKKEEHHKAVIESIFKFVPEGVLVLTESLNLLRHNKAFDDIVQKYAPLLGYTEQELAEKIVEQLRSEIKSGDSKEIHIRKNGQLGTDLTENDELILQFGTARIFLAEEEEEEEANIVVSLSDITAHKKSEEALKQSEEQYRKFFEDDLAGNYIATPDGELLACNPAFARIFGFISVEEVLKTNVNALYSDTDERKRFLGLLREKEKLEYYETEYVRSDGKRLHAIENAVAIFDTQGNFVQIRGYLFDDTKRKLLEEQLLQAQKLESLGTLAGGIAHDFNNILGIILGHSSLLERLKGDAAGLSQSIEAITKATERGASLVKQLLTFARKTEALLEPVRVNDIIEEIKKLLQVTFPKTITISKSLQQDLPVIVAEAGQIHQVLLNLCVNARDAMPKKGTLSISTSTVEGESVSSQFPKVTARQYVQIKVADTGIGMNEATRQRMFEPFFSTKGVGKGTGLGLALVFGIVQNHNGFIDVRSAPGEGTSFTVYLPIPERAPEISQPTRQGVGQIPGGRETILVIEDEEMLRELVKAVLVSKGYTVLTAEDGLQGVEMYQKHQNEIAVVLTDAGLPILSGQDVFRRIREMNPAAKVIMASGFIEPQMKSEMYKAGLRNFIQKPYKQDEVLRKMREIIDTNE